MQRNAQQNIDKQKDTHTHTHPPHLSPQLCQSIMEYNGSAIVAMTGKDCVAIAADRRLGAQAQTVSTDFQKLYQMGPKLFIGLPGLATDVLTVYVAWNPTTAQSDTANEHKQTDRQTQTLI